MKSKPFFSLIKRLFTLFILSLVWSSCKKSLDPVSATTTQLNATPTPTGLSLVNSTVVNGKIKISLKWDSISTSSIANYKIYRSTNLSTNSLVATIAANKNTYTDSLNLQFSTTYYYWVTAVNSLNKESTYSTPLNTATRNVTENNNFQLNNASNMVLLNQAISTSDNRNILLTDESGNVVSLVIPDAKSYKLNINYLVPCTPKYLYLNGSLQVEYLSGKIQSYNNFIMDVETGNFYQLETDFGPLWSRTGTRKTPWVNGTIQYDSNNSIYIQSSSNSYIQEITKFEFIKSSATSMSVRTSVINLIGESYYFNYFVLRNGGIMYMHKVGMGEMTWKYRSTSGATIEMTDIVANKPLVIDGIRYFDSVYPEKCFLIIDSKDKPILFVSGRDASGTSIATPNYMDDTVRPFTVEIDASNKIILKPIVNAKFKLNHNPDNATPLVLGGSESNTLFSDYYHGMFYFRQGTKHIFTNRWGTGSNSFWWNYDDQSNQMLTNFIPYSPLDFSTYNPLMTNSANYAFLPIKRSFFAINFADLTWSSTNNLNFQMFKTNYQGNDKVQFYGISYLNGKKVLGEISKDGVVKILKEFDDVFEIKDLIRIGTY